VKEIKRYTEAEMPEDILGKVSVLNITDVDEYVEDVGYNTGDGMFYVVK
jgi:tetrahydromethanopterin S-methyltransferase subunit F